MIRPGSGEVPASPPAGFALFGLDAAWPGTRWLDSFGDAVGDEVRWIRLAHSNPAAGELMLLSTHSRPLADADAARGGEAALESVSSRAAFTLVNLTLPERPAPRPEGLIRVLVNLADERGRRHAEWTPVTWRVDGLAVPAWAWEFAGGWAAFTDGLDDVYLAVSGLGGSPDGLALTRLREASAYHFDLEQPLDGRAIRASSAAAWPDGEEIWWERAAWHTDQVRLMPGHA